MKKTFGSILALILAVIFAVSSSAAAWADGEENNTTDEQPEPAAQVGTASVSVTGLMPGEKVSAYKVVSYTADYHGYIYETGFESYLTGIAGAGADISEYFQSQSTASQIKALIENYVSAGTLPAQAYDEMYVAADGTQVTFTLEPGYYIFLVRTTAENSRIYLPMSAFVRVDGDKLAVTGGSGVTGADAVELTAKYKDGPTIDKMVWCAVHGRWDVQTDASVGGILDFYVRVEIPAYAGSVENVELTVRDTMSGMRYAAGSARVYGSEPLMDAAGAASGTLIENALIGAPAEDENGLVSFTLDYKTIAPAAAERTVYIYYQAVSDALDAGIASNTAVLTYKIAAGEEKTTSPKTTAIYNYLFALNKVDGKDAPLSGAKFSICSDEAGIQKLSFLFMTEEDGSKTYYPCTAGTAGAVTELEASPDITVVGLGSGVYYVKEESTPRGYFAPAGVFRLDLHSYEPLGQGTTADHEKLSAAHCAFTNLADEDKELAPDGLKKVEVRQYTVSLRNLSTPVLPATGGTGTVMFTVGGAAVMALAAVLFLKRKKEE